LAPGGAATGEDEDEDEDEPEGGFDSELRIPNSALGWVFHGLKGAL
jgi:hypothetical protein